MFKKFTGLCLAFAAASAWSGPQVSRSETFPLERNIAVDIYAPGAIRAEIAISTSSLKDVQRYDLKVSEGALAGGVYLPPGKENFVSITAFDAHGEKLYSGKGNVAVDEKFTPQLDIPLQGRESRLPPTAKFGTNRFGLGLAAGPAEEGLILQATLFDAMGNHLPFKPDDIRWVGLPEKFELIKYSCFRESLCIELPKDRINEDLLACWRDVTCSIPDPPDTRGPYWYVVTGRTHTCALTVNNDIHCWGDNRYGQLRATPTNCPASVSSSPSDCSPVPLPIQCGPGEVCKFVSLSAGGERTCAVDTAGKLWCWGSAPDQFSGAPVPVGSGDKFNGEVQASLTDEDLDTFIAVDTDLMHSCAISSSRALYCWELNQSRLDYWNVHSRGTQYRSVSVGKGHKCAEKMNGDFECWGNNSTGAINGSYNGGPHVIHPGLQEILTRGGHRPAAGDTMSCAQSPNDDTICWGTPSSWLLPTIPSGGWMALHYSYATSLASNTDICPKVGGPEACSRICATGLGGDLWCGNWKYWATPSQLPMVPDPASDHYISWNQADVGPNHVCAVNTQRDIWCFGTNAFGQFGTGTTSTTRTDAPMTPVTH